MELISSHYRVCGNSASSWSRRRTRRMAKHQASNYCINSIKKPKTADTTTTTRSQNSSFTSSIVSNNDNSIQIKGTTNVARISRHKQAAGGLSMLTAATILLLAATMATCYGLTQGLDGSAVSGTILANSHIANPNQPPEVKVRGAQLSAHSDTSEDSTVTLRPRREAEHQIASVHLSRHITRTPKRRRRSLLGARQVAPGRPSGSSAKLGAAAASAQPTTTLAPNGNRQQLGGDDSVAGSGQVASATKPPTATAIKNVTAQNGQSVLLHCLVEPSSDLTVSWFRGTSELQLLTLDSETIVPDERFVVRHGLVQENDWALQIKGLDKNLDAGLYQCQVNTEPPQSQYYQLNIVEPQVHILGAPDLAVRLGAPINLTCLISQSPDQLAYVFWYRDGKMINYDIGDRGKIVLSKLSHKQDTISSQLQIFHSKTSDSANYTCMPSGARPVSINVHVLEGSNKQLIMFQNDYDPSSPISSIASSQQTSSAISLHLDRLTHGRSYALLVAYLILASWFEIVNQVQTQIILFLLAVIGYFLSQLTDLASEASRRRRRADCLSSSSSADRTFDDHETYWLAEAEKKVDGQGGHQSIGKKQKKKDSNNNNLTGDQHNGRGVRDIRQQAADLATSKKLSEELAAEAKHQATKRKFSKRKPKQSSTSMALDENEDEEQHQGLLCSPSRELGDRDNESNGDDDEDEIIMQDAELRTAIQMDPLIRRANSALNLLKALSSPSGSSSSSGGSGAGSSENGDADHEAASSSRSASTAPLAATPTSPSVLASTSRSSGSPRIRISPHCQQEHQSPSSFSSSSSASTGYNSDTHSTPANRIKSGKKLDEDMIELVSQPTAMRLVMDEFAATRRRAQPEARDEEQQEVQADKLEPHYSTPGIPQVAASESNSSSGKSPLP